MSSSRKRRVSDDDEIENDPAESRNASDEYESIKAAAGTTSSSKRSRPEPTEADDMEEDEKQSDTLFRSINRAGRPAEAGIIVSVHVENFMCHRKLTIPLCRNVNFIHGQNGSGKSAILAAIQICLGAGARRTHRARNLKDLVRKESANSCNCAKVQVKLLNQGGDAFQHEIYGDYITVERTISLNGGYNGYKLLDANGKEQSRSKKDLDAMLDQLNIQVDNPVAVLDQEEAKKFLTGKAEDKYNFFNKATDLERLDRTYVNVQDYINELDETKANVECSLAPARDNVMKLKEEWEKFRQLGKLEEQLSLYRVQYAWSFYWSTNNQLTEEENNVRQVEERLAKRKQDLEKALESMNNDNSNENEIKDKLKTLTDEAAAAAEARKDIESQLKTAMLPIKQHERNLANFKREIDTAKGRLKSAVNELQEARREIARKQGSAQSIEAKRTERLNACEGKLSEAKEAKGTIAEELDFYRKKYEELETANETAQTSVDKIKRQIAGADKKLRDIVSVSSESNNLRLFGEKCPEMTRRVDQYVAERKFRGLVLGPIGKYLKVMEGKEDLAPLAELSVGAGVLDRFIVTNDADRTIFMKLRTDVGCGPRECNIFQVHEGPRHQVKPAPEGVETATTVFNVTESLVFNCLVDHANADQMALMKSKESSERALLIESNGRCSIRGGNIKQVFFLPNGDKWQVSRGGALSMISNTKRLNQTIGLDRTRAIQEAEREIDILRRELRDADDQLMKVKRERDDYKKNWNIHSSKLKANDAEIKKLEMEIDDLRTEAESAQNETYDTTELEDDVKAAEEDLQTLRRKESDSRKAIDDLQPEADVIKRTLEETMARNAKVVADIDAIEKKLHEVARHQNEKTREIEKRRFKVEEAERALREHGKLVAVKVKDNNDALSKARDLNWKYLKSSAAKDDCESKNHDEPVDVSSGMKTATDDDLAAIEPMKTEHDPDFYRNRIQKAEKEIEREKVKRNLSERDPEVAYTKYMRAKKDLDSKMVQIEHIDTTILHLRQDLKSRRKLFKKFRSHIARETSHHFDRILSKKGSSGDITFDHEGKTLNMIVQKDNQNVGTQTSDVKALSGGERSYTTLSLLLALGESLETPFRVMDEFDVFLDPLSRKIALDNLVQVGKDMEHRQFIFITPQDLSSLQTDPKLKIIVMKPPERSQVVGGPTQSTLT